MSNTAASATRRQEWPSGDSQAAPRGAPSASTAPTMTYVEPFQATAVGRASVGSGRSDRAQVLPSLDCQVAPMMPESDSSEMPTATNPAGPPAMSISPASGPLSGIMSPTASPAGSAGSQ